MKIDRLISIIMILLERQKASIPELAEICEVSPRTISRDLETINQAGIPIVSYPGLHGGVGIMENYKLEKRLFSTADVTTLLMGLGCIQSSLPGREVVNALAKVKGLIPEKQRREIELRAGRLVIDMTPWLGNSGCIETFQTIQQAMEQSRLLQFAYTDRQRQKNRRTVEPYRLLLKGMRWYLDGYSLERQDFRLFKLSRMQEVILSDTGFVVRNYHPEDKVHPNFQDENIVMVTVRVKGNAVERLEEMFGANIFTEENGAWHTVQISLTDDARGYRFLLGFGDDCVCIAPENVRKNITDYLNEIGKMY